MSYNAPLLIITRAGKGIALAKTTSAAYVAPFLLYVGIARVGSQQPQPAAKPIDFFLLFGAVLLLLTGFVAGSVVGPVIGLPMSLGAPPITVVPTFRVTCWVIGGL